MSLTHYVLAIDMFDRDFDPILYILAVGPLCCDETGLICAFPRNDVATLSCAERMWWRSSRGYLRLAREGYKLI